MATALTLTVPPLVSGLRLLSARSFKRHKCCVFPICGIATVFPSKSATLLISDPFLLTSTAPPFVALEIITTSPLDLTLALIAGTGPIYPISISPENNASTSAGPALNAVHFTLTSSPRVLSRVPSAFIIKACACVILLK